MTETLQVAGVVLAAVNVLVIPALVAAGRWLWRVERRLIKIETKMGIED